MSTFDGKIREIPGISVDCFLANNYDSIVFFLSHFHSDHYRGLYPNGKQLIIEKGLPLYTSTLTKEIIKRKCPELAVQVRELEMQKPTSIAVGGKSLSVTLIPAGHCLGSVMFLFESESSRILYTGDYRIGSSDQKKFRCLYDSLGDVKKIDKIYLDTTFFLESYPTFPTRTQSMSVISDLIKEWTSQNSDNVIQLDLSANYGYEFLFQNIYAMCNMKVWAGDNTELYSIIPELDDCFTTSPHKAKIFCNQVPTSVHPDNIRIIKPSAYRWTNSDKEPTAFHDNKDVSKYLVCYSTHASYEEGLALIHFLKPKDIYICVERKDPGENLRMKQLIQQALTKENSAKDIKLFNPSNSIFSLSTTT